jgi:type VI secretion system protein VasG
VSLTDTACARVAISQHAVPASVEDCRRRIEALETELEIVGRETAVGVEHRERQNELEEMLQTEKARLADLEERWEQEKNLVNSILEIRSQLRQVPDGTIEQAERGDQKKNEREAAEVSEPAKEKVSKAPGNTENSEKERNALLEQLTQLNGQLADLQKENPLILPSVDEQAVASVVADWTGIPVGRMVKNEIEAVLNLADGLEKRVIGQRHALDAIAKRIRTSRAGLDNPNRPVGVFLLVGPSGVGKTETALAVAEALYGGEHNVITINMSEFQEAHTVSTLKGAPPGYVGYGEGGILTEAVRRRPYSVVLLDEVEKAHPDVHEIFFQVFDKGMMEDGEGRLIDFKNTIILLTSNAGSDLIMDMCKDPALMPEPEGIAKAMREPLLKVFPAALLGRLVVVPYYPISDEVLQSIIRLQLRRIEKRLRENQKIPFTYDEDVVEQIGSRCTELESGARMVDAILTHTLLPTISQEYLTRLMEGKTIEKVHISVEGGDFRYIFE